MTDPTLPDFCKNVAQLKRIVAIPSITLERLATLGFPARPPRTIARVLQREIMFSDGAWLTFPRAANFSCSGDVIQWGALSFRISITPELYKSEMEAKDANDKEG
jgi:hypothetical protein